MKIFAHRGFSGCYPENTMLAFSEAVKVGSYGIELDVHHSKDNKLVIIHDESLVRTTGMPGVVSDYFLEDLKNISAGKTFDDRFGNTPIPSFDEYCDFIEKTDVVTNIEIKTNRTYYTGIEEHVLETIRTHRLQEKVLISSFNWLSVIRFKQLAPEIECGLLQEDTPLQNIGSLAALMKVECYHPGFNILDDRVVQSCKENSIKLNVWTINSEEQMFKLLEWNANSAITNYPDLGLRLSKSR